MKKAIILAAGVGKRLGSLTKDIPKCLLPIDTSSVLIDFSLEALYENSIKEIIVVTGFAREKLEEHIRKSWSNKLFVRFIFNSKYKEYNNIYSAYLAKDLWDDETILLNSDIVFHPDILRNLKSKIENQGTINRAPTRSYLVIDNTKTLSFEDMKVIVNEKNEIKRINKNLDIKKSFGEYIGITYLRDKERVKFLESLENNVNAKNLDLYYEDALDQILDGVSIFPLSTAGKSWTEVDTKEDYEHAKKIASVMKKIKIS